MSPYAKEVCFAVPNIATPRRSSQILRDGVINPNFLEEYVVGVIGVSPLSRWNLKKSQPITSNLVKWRVRKMLGIGKK